MTSQRVHARYPDRSVSSPGGELTLSSQHLASTWLWGEHRARLTLHQGERVLWSSATVVRRGSPQELWVDDSGWSAVLYGHDLLVLLSPEGERRAEAKVLERIAADPGASGMILRSTAGPFWDQAPLGSFVLHRGARCFVLRCFWGFRMVLCAEGRAVAPAEVAEAAREAEVSQSIRLLEGLGLTVERDLRLSRAATLLGAERCHEAAPLLRRCSSVQEPWSLSGCFDGQVRDASGARAPIDYQAFALRLALGQALLRLGEVPTLAAPYAFSRGDAGRAVLVDRPADWAEASGSLEVGMTFSEVLERSGCPTWLGWGSSRPVCYDLPGRSVSLRFTEGVLFEVEIDHDQRWIDDFHRERWDLR